MGWMRMTEEGRIIIHGGRIAVREVGWSRGGKVPKGNMMDEKGQG